MKGRFSYRPFYLQITMDTYNSFNELAAANGNTGGMDVFNAVVENMTSFSSAPYAENSKAFWFGGGSHDQGESPHVHVNPAGRATENPHEPGTFKVWLCYGPNKEVKEGDNYGVSPAVVNRVVEHIRANQEKFLNDWNAFFQPPNTGEPKYDTPEEAIAASKAAQKAKKRKDKGYAEPDRPEG